MLNMRDFHDDGMVALTAKSVSRPSRKPNRMRTVLARDAQLTDQTKQLIAVRDARDKSAFAALFDFFAPRLKAMVLKSGASSGQAEEIVQDVMLSVWRKADQFDAHRAQASTWIYQIARNRHIDVVRKENKAVPEALKCEEESTDDAAQMIAVQEETVQLQLALKGLKPDQRDMIEKAYIGEMTHQEISHTTGLPLGTIKSRIRLGLERLRYELKELR